MQIAYLNAVMFVAYVGMMAARTAYPLYVLELGGNAFLVGLIAAVNQLPAIFSYHVGLVQARLGYRRMQALGALCGGVSFVMPYFFPGLPMLYLSAALCGVWGLLILGPTQSLFGLLSAPQALARNFSHYNVLAWLTGFLGPLIAGFSIEAMGYRMAFALLLVFALATLAMLAFWNRVISAIPERPSVPPRLRSVLADRRLLGILIAGAATQIGMDMFPVFMSVYGHALALAPSQIGMLIAGSSASAVVLCLVLPALVARFREEPLLAVSLLLAGLCFALIPLFDRFAPLMALSLLFGLGIGAGQPLTTMVVFKRAQPGTEGAAIGLRLLFTSATKVTGPTVFGALTAALGVATMLLAAAATLGLSAWHVRHSTRPGPA